MKKIIYSLWILLFIFACSDNNDLDYSDLKVTLQKSKIDVGENTQQLDIPVILTGCRNDIPVDVRATVTATDGTALSGKDYELITNEISFSNCGESTISIKIMDNDVISSESKTFTIQLNVSTAKVTSEIKTAEIFIISDDHEVKKFEIVGNYTLTAKEFPNDNVLKSESGSVEITQDEEDPNRYWIKNMSYLVEHEGKTLTFPLSLNPEGLYFTVNEDGSMQMPLQNIGEYEEDTPATIIPINTDEMVFTKTPFEIAVVRNSLVFGPNAFGGIALDDEDQVLNVYYVLKNLTLTKVTE